MVRIAFHYLGCRLNEAENERIARDLVEAGHQVVSLESHPEVIILNTCGVTSEAMRKSRNLARRMAAIGPSVLVLMGCAVDLMASGETPVPDEALRAESRDEIDVVRIFRDDRPVATRKILDAIARHWPDDERESHSIYPLRMRSFIKIQDGCNNQCTYCSVRLARGRERSESAASIVSEIRRCLELGEREIVLTGVQLGAWHEGARHLPELLQEILSGTSVTRLRLSSIEPWHVRESLWSLWKDARLCPHFHIPVQSGSDEVLAAMKRRTPLGPYEEKIAAIRQCVPNVRISTDLIVGFPGETEAMWRDTMAFLERVQFDDVHLFRFSARPGTVAASLPDPVPAEEKRRRWNEAERRIREIRRARMKRFVGERFRVLWETSGEEHDGMRTWSGYTENYLRVSRDMASGVEMRGQVTDEIFVENDVSSGEGEG